MLNLIQSAQKLNAHFIISKHRDEQADDIPMIVKLFTQSIADSAQEDILTTNFQM